MLFHANMKLETVNSAKHSLCQPGRSHGPSVSFLTWATSLPVLLLLCSSIHVFSATFFFKVIIQTHGVYLDCRRSNVIVQ